MIQPQLFANPATPKPPPNTREIARRRTGTKKRDILRALMRSLLDGPVSADACAYRLRDAGPDKSGYTDSGPDYYDMVQAVYAEMFGKEAE